MKNNNFVQVIEDVDEFYKNISNNVKKLRKKHKLSQLDFASNIGFNSVSFYCDCENNTKNKHFNLLHVVRIAKFLNVDINEIVKY